MSVRRKQDGRPGALPCRVVRRRVGACHTVTGGKAQENLQPTHLLITLAQVVQCTGVRHDSKSECTNTQAKSWAGRCHHVLDSQRGIAGHADNGHQAVVVDRGRLLWGQPCTAAQSALRNSVHAPVAASPQGLQAKTRACCLPAVLSYLHYSQSLGD